MARRIEIKPNRSLTPAAAAWFFAGLATLCLGIAVTLASMGFWLVLPFAGAELSLLGLVLFLSFRTARRRELIHIDAERVVVEQGPGRPAGRWEFRRPWVRIDLEPAPVRNHPSRLLLRQSDRVCEIGRCLTEHERTSLCARLREILTSR